jgi:3-isopropylmalate/(R)-2-methylmalate dehydratase small subunit
MKDFDGGVLFLDRSDINTDEIIPAKYLTENTREAMGPHLLEDLQVEGFVRQRDLTGIKAIVARENFGCGSSREHAPWALEANGIYTVFAVSFARIFRQNMFNCGMMAIELPLETIDSLFRRFAGRPAEFAIDLETMNLRFQSDKDIEELPLALPGFDRSLVKAGGWLEYADARY